MASYLAICLALLLEGGGVMVAAHHSVGLSAEQLCVFNSGNAFFDTGFALGDYMSLRVEFLLPSNMKSATGHVIAGYAPIVVWQDRQDYRVFVAGRGTTADPFSVYADAGDGRGQYALTDWSSFADVWHVVDFPSAAGVATLDGESVFNMHGPYATEGAYGSAGRTMWIFGQDDDWLSESTSQVSAVARITVYGTLTGEVMCDLVADRRGGFYDKVSKNLILPSKGSVEIVRRDSLT